MTRLKTHVTFAAKSILRCDADWICFRRAVAVNSCNFLVLFECIGWKIKVLMRKQRIFLLFLTWIKFQTSINVHWSFEQLLTWKLIVSLTYSTLWPTIRSSSIPLMTQPVFHSNTLSKFYWQTSELVLAPKVQGHSEN